ncbi:MAG: carbonic anhydrase, partial [Tepidiphilus sp.]|nr:carbonic anhydrase [Tepidiphilus sp.]
AIRADAPELVQHWVHPIRELYLQHRAELDALPEPERTHRLVRMNVVTQIERLAQNPVIRRAWDRGEGPMLHGWIYDVGDGLLEDLGVLRGPC